MKSFSEIDDNYTQALLEKDTILASGYARQFLGKAKKEGDIKAINYGYNMHAAISPNKIAHLYYDSIIHASKIKPDDINPREAYYNKGVLFYKYVELKKALEYFSLLLNQSIEDKDLVFEIVARIYIGIIKREHTGGGLGAIEKLKKCLKKIEPTLSPTENSDVCTFVIRSFSEEYRGCGGNTSYAYFIKTGYDFSTIRCKGYFRNCCSFSQRLNEFSGKNNSASLDSLSKIYPQFKITDDLANRMEIEGSLFLLNQKYLENSFYQKLLVIGFFCIGLLFIVIIFKRTKKKDLEFNTNLKEQDEVKNKCKNDFIISEEIVDRIVNELVKFEENQKYLTPNLTSFKLAKILGTNRKYLSYIIKKHRHKSLPNYINELRIDYAIKRLKEDKVFRNYTVDAIAKEVGFLNTLSFSQAFKNKTNLNASAFISNLEKEYED